MFKYWLGAILIVVSQQAFALNCKSLVEHQITNQLDTSRLFNNRKDIVVVVICAQKPLPIYFVLHTKLMSEEQLMKSITPMSTFVHVKPPVNPNGKTKVTGFLAVNRAKDNSFTLRLRARLATGEAIDIAKKVVLSTGESIVFEDSEVQVGIARLALYLANTSSISVAE
jgi:hypothetical protein